MEKITPAELKDGAAARGDPDHLEDATAYVARTPNDELVYDVSAIDLSSYEYLSYDILVDGDPNARFVLTMEGNGREFRFVYVGTGRCEARLRLPLEATDQDRLVYHRDGGLLDRFTVGDPVDLDNVDRITISPYYIIHINNKELAGREVDFDHLPGAEIEWEQTPMTFTATEPDELETPLLTEGELLDPLGQSALRDWENKRRSRGQVRDSLRQQRSRATSAPAADSRPDGGDVDRRFEASGYFRVQQTEDRWWLVDPEGRPFWSSGVNCVRPSVPTHYGGLEDALEWLPDESNPGRETDADVLDFLVANLARAFGADSYYDAWEEITREFLSRAGFNTIGNWSDEQFVQNDDRPYVVTLGTEFPSVKDLYRGFPDVLDPDFEEDVRQIAAKLEDVAADRQLIGYFIQNQPAWTLEESPAEGLLRFPKESHTRDELVDVLEEKYATSAALSRSWGMDVTFDELRSDAIETKFTQSAIDDLRAFSERITATLFREISEACRRVDENHLNLGIRFAADIPEWMLASVDPFDVLTMNCYQPKLPAEVFERYSSDLGKPILVGEWAFGALDVGLPEFGRCEVRDQRSRAEALRVYLEDAMAQPWCIGAHWHQLYDQSALGRADGSASNFGLLDVCNQPYEEVVSAFRTTHSRQYDVVTRRAEPYTSDVTYFPSIKSASTS